MSIKYAFSKIQNDKEISPFTLKYSSYCESSTKIEGVEVLQDGKIKLNPSSLEIKEFSIKVICRNSMGNSSEDVYFAVHENNIIYKMKYNITQLPSYQLKEATNGRIELLFYDIRDESLTQRDEGISITLISSSNASFARLNSGKYEFYNEIKASMKDLDNGKLSLDYININTEAKSVQLKIEILKNEIVTGHIPIVQKVSRECKSYDINNNCCNDSLDICGICNGDNTKCAIEIVFYLDNKTIISDSTKGSLKSGIKKSLATYEYKVLNEELVYSILTTYRVTIVLYIILFTLE